MEKTKFNCIRDASHHKPVSKGWYPLQHILDTYDQNAYVEQTSQRSKLSDLSIRNWELWKGSGLKVYKTT